MTQIADVGRRFGFGEIEFADFLDDFGHQFAVPVTAVEEEFRETSDEIGHVIMRCHHGNQDGADDWQHGTV